MPSPITRTELQELSEHGFLRYAAEPRALEEWIKHFQHCGLLEPDATGRSFYIDAEDLAEGGARDALEQLGPFLARQGITLGVSDVKYEEESNCTFFEVNNRRQVLCDWTVSSDATWEGTSVIFFGVVNALLREAGTQERLYAWRPYMNDQVGIFLSNKLLSLLRNHGAGKELHRIDREL